jgi:hypothetical protein
MAAWLTLGMLLAAAGCASCHLSVRHQHWLTRPLPARPARLAGAVLLAAALVALAQAMQVVVAVFVFVTWTMLVCVALPHADALLALYRKPPQ